MDIPELRENVDQYRKSWEKAEYGPKVDVYAFGIVMFEMLVGYAT